MDKLEIHITFHYNEQRLEYLHKIINEELTYPFETHIFIHSNKDFIIENAIVLSYFVPLNLRYHLSFTCRKKINEQIHDYDYFMYIEDDIFVPKQAIEYFLQYSL